MSNKPLVQGLFDPDTFTVTYVVHSGKGSSCAIIDSVLDYDPKSGRTSHTSADAVVDYVEANDLSVTWILETHAHADHLSGAPYLRSKLGGRAHRHHETRRFVLDAGRWYYQDGDVHGTS